MNLFNSNLNLLLFVSTVFIALSGILHIYYTHGLVYDYNCNIIVLIVTCLPVLTKVMCTYNVNNNAVLSKLVMSLILQTLFLLVNITWCILWFITCNISVELSICMIVSIILMITDFLILSVNVMLSSEMSGIMRDIPPLDQDNAELDSSTEQLSYLDVLTDVKRDVIVMPEVNIEESVYHVTRDSPPSVISDLECSVCMDITHTVVKGCYHPLCVNCCSNYMSYMTNRSMFICPVCRQPYITSV